MDEYAPKHISMAVNVLSECGKAIEVSAYPDVKVRMSIHWPDILWPPTGTTDHPMDWQITYLNSRDVSYASPCPHLNLIRFQAYMQYRGPHRVRSAPSVLATTAAVRFSRAPAKSASRDDE